MEPEGEYGGGGDGEGRGAHRTKPRQEGPAAAGRLQPRPPLRVKCFLQTETSFQSASLIPTKGNETQHGGVTAMSGTNQNTAELGRSRSQCYMWYHRTGSKQGGVILTGGARRWCLRGNRRGWSSGHLTGFTELYSMNTPLGVGGWCLAGLTVCADQVPGGRAPRGSGVSHRGSGVTADGR